jgi:dipeptidyl aminopeptidase/acylaminoacyl peptidase/5'-3' exonuclease
VIVHLVDGTYELFRQFYGARRGTKGEDRPYAGVTGVLHSMLEMVEKGGTHLGVATDRVIESFRNGLWPGYKTGAGVERALMAQFRPLEDALEALGFAVWPMVELEADDALASAARLASRDERVEKVCIWTPDKDLAQCVDGDRVVQVDRRSGQIRNAAAVREKFGVPPELVADFLALVGDAADGYPGIKGIGRTTAARLLARHGPIEAFPEAVLGEDRALALRFKELATLRTDAPLFRDVEERQMRAPCALALGLVFAASTTFPALAAVKPPVPLSKFFETKRLGPASVSGDETLAAFLSDQGGRIDFWTAPLAGGPAKQLTHVQGFVGNALFSPVDRTLAYEADTGGTELMHLWIASADGGAAKDVTSDLPNGARIEIQDWARDGKTLLYTSSARDPKFLDLYELDVATGKSERLWEASGNLAFALASRDHTKFVIFETISDGNYDLHLVERGKPGMTLLTPHEGEVLHSAAAFSGDGKTLYVTSNLGGEFVSLYALDLATKKLTPVYMPKWDVDDAGISPDGRFLYSVTNEDGTPRLAVKDLVSGKDVTLPKAPSGGFESPRFSKSGRYLGVVLRSDTTPAVPYVLDLEKGTALKLEEALPEELRALAMPTGASVRIPTFDGREVPAYLYRGRGGKPHGAVIWVHGGPTDQSRRLFNIFAQYLLTKGYDVLIPNVRGSTGYGKTWTKLNNKDIGGGPLKDVVACKKWLVAKADVPGDKVVVLGGSYGGYMSLCAEAFAPEEFAANVDCFGVCDLKSLVESFPAYWASFSKEIHVKFGDPADPKDARYQHDESPLFFAERMKRPLLVVQGDKDARVKKDQSDRIVASLKSRGIPVHYLVLENEGHGFSRNESYRAAYEATDRFLDRYLGGDASVTVLAKEAQ